MTLRLQMDLLPIAPPSGGLGRRRIGGHSLGTTHCRARSSLTLCSARIARHGSGCRLRRVTPCTHGRPMCRSVPSQRSRFEDQALRLIDVALTQAVDLVPSGSCATEDRIGGRSSSTTRRKRVSRSLSLSQSGYLRRACYRVRRVVAQTAGLSILSR